MIKPDYVKHLIIRGSGATVSVKNPNDHNSFHFLHINGDTTLWVNNITIKGFNTAIYNYGSSQFKNVIFENNRVDYVSANDYGGAVRNYGIIKCLDCSFIKNYAKYGGAVYNQQGSQAFLNDCYYYKNQAYGSGGERIRTNDNRNVYTSKGASCVIFNHDDEIHSISINSKKDYDNLHGAAIFNQGILRLTDCKFENNHAYGKGNNVCNGNYGYVIVNNEVVRHGNEIVSYCSKDIKENFFVRFIHDLIPNQGNEFPDLNSQNIFDKIAREEKIEAIDILHNIFRW